jgi:hypothetical protein
MSAQFLNWKVTAILCTLILSGTALFIYEDFKSEQLRQRQQAEAQQQKPWIDFQPDKNHPVRQSAATNVFDIFDEAAKNQPARQKTQTFSDADFLNAPNQKKELTDAEIGIVPAAPVSSPAPIFKFVTPKPPDPILEEMRRANDIAEDRLRYDKIIGRQQQNDLHQQQSDLIWLQSLQTDDLHRIRQIYERQDFRQQYGGH